MNGGAIIDPIIQIYYFNFNTTLPIFGGVLGENSVAINKNLYADSLTKLFILLHESCHSDQIKDNSIKPYFDNVKNDNYELFIKAYVFLEQKANDFAFDAMKELGYDSFVENKEKSLRMNEMSGNRVFHSMKFAIDKYKSNSIEELIREMIFKNKNPFGKHIIYI